MKTTKIHIQDLHVRYGHARALKGISMNLYEKQVTALIGPSGCGKSTFLRAINRMNDLISHAETRGKIMIGGQDIYAADTDVVDLRQRVGMVFQRPTPFPKSILDNVTYGPKLYGIRRRDQLLDIVESSLRRAALWDEVKDRLRSPALTLSGGQQQRLCIARALAVEPEVLLMDEPASALDPLATAKIEELITSLSERHTIIVVTHNMQQAARVSDFTAFFLDGGLVEYDQTAKLFRSPHHQPTQQYLAGAFG